MPEVFISFEQSVQNGWISPGGILLAGHPLFEETLKTPSADILHGLRHGESANQRHLIFGADGILRQTTAAGLNDYIESGEYDQRTQQIEEQ